MSSQNTRSPSDRIAESYQKLSVSAAELNAASDELGRSVAALDAALKRLNLGISAWVQVTGYEDPNLDYWSRALGYSKVGGKWGIAINAREGNENCPEDSSYEEWLFQDAPRTFRLEAVDKLPDLLETLINAAEKTTNRTVEKTKYAQELAKAIPQSTKSK